MDKELEEAIEFAISENKRKQKIVNEARLNNRFTAFCQDLQKKIDNEEILLNYIENSIPKKKLEDKKKLFEEGIDFNKEYKDKTLEDIVMESQWAMLEKLLEDK